MASQARNKQLIMAIDDEPNVTAAIKRTLSRQDFEVIEVNDPKTVENYILYADIKLVITDLKMPGRSGLEVLRDIRMSKPEIPVIILTGHGSIDSAIEATKLGAAEFLSKPINSQKLLEAVKKHANKDDMIADQTMQLLKQKSLHSPEVFELRGDKLLLKDEIISTDSIPEGFVEAKFEYLVPGEPLPFAVFVQIFNKTTKRFFLRRVCDKGKILTSGIRHMLYKRELTSFFVLEEDYRSYLSFFSKLKSSPMFRHQMIKDEKKLVLYGKAVESITETLTSKIDNSVIRQSIEMVDNIFRKMVKDPDTYQDMFKMFKKDNSIFNHSVNVCLFAVSFGIYLRLDDQTIKYLGLGGLYHDVGMGDIHKDILEKPEPLTPEEWNEIKMHPIKGAEKIQAATIFPPQSLRIIKEHHEETKGTGYPLGLKGFQISNSAVLVKIIDKFDSMTTDKTYRKAFTPVDALKRLLVEEPSEKIRGVIRKFILFLGGK